VEPKLPGTAPELQEIEKIELPLSLYDIIIFIEAKVCQEK
jgi:hypothetical protein